MERQKPPLKERLNNLIKGIKNMPSRFMRGLRTLCNALVCAFKAVCSFVVHFPHNAKRFFKAVPKTVKHIIISTPSAIKNAPANIKRAAVFIKQSDKSGLKRFLFGNGEKRGFVQLFICYSLLILFGFVYLYPMFYMLGYSLMNASDVVNPMVNYVPTKLFFGNYKEAVLALDFWGALFSTLLVSVPSALLQMVAASLTGYGLARFNFFGKKLIFALVIVTFVIPPQITMMPQVLMFSRLKLTDSLLAYYVPALFGQGIKSPVFILIFYQFFKAMPKSIEEAAKIDGSGTLTIFIRLGLPLALPGYLLGFLLSMVWYYNETVLAAIYFGNEWTTLPLQLERFKAAYEELFGSASVTGKSVNEAINMSGTMLTILPLLIIFFFTQRFFVDGIDKAGITGE